jgi:hypothetical protein
VPVRIPQIVRVLSTEASVCTYFGIIPCNYHIVFYAIAYHTMLASFPIAGTTTLLRLISGRALSHGSFVKNGDITLGGVPLAQLAATSGINYNKYANYCSDEDHHEMLFTVKETFEFAHKCAHVDTTTLGAEQAPASTAAVCTLPTPADMLRITGLEHAANTIAGESASDALEPTVSIHLTPSLAVAVIHHRYVSIPTQCLRGITVLCVAPVQVPLFCAVLAVVRNVD